MTVKRKIKKKLKQLFIIDVTPTTGVIFISVLAVIYFFVNTTVIATAMPLSLAGYKFFNLIGIDIMYQYQMMIGNGFGWDVRAGGVDNISNIMASFRVNF